ncbi:hypothetical protein D9M71_282120 [compost metagenome]
MLFLDRSHLRRHRAHAGHRAVAGGGQREEGQLDDHGQQDDRPAPVTEQAVDMLQQPEDRLGDEPQPAVVDGQFQARRELLQVALQFGTGIQHDAGFGLAARCDTQVGAGETDDVVTLAVLAGHDLVSLTLGRNPGGHEVVLQPGNPATLHGFLELLLVHVLGGHFQVGLLGSPEGRAEVGGDAGGGSRGRVGAAVALELGEQVATPGLSALVVDQVGDINLIGVGVDALDLLLRLFLLAAIGLQAAMEGKALDVVDAIAAVAEVDHQLVLAIGQLVGALCTAVQRTAVAVGVGAVGAGQAALGQVGALLVALEQRERYVGAILAQRILQQAQFYDVATARVDRQAEYVGFHLDQLIAGCSGGLFARKTGAGSLCGRHVGTSGSGHRSVRQSLAGADGSGLRRQFGLTVVLVPLENQHIGHDCKGDD